YRDDVVHASRTRYGRIRAEVEAGVNKKQLDFAPPPKKEKERRDGGSTYGSRPRDNFPPRDPGRAPRDVLPRRDIQPARPPVTAPSRDDTQRDALRAALAAVKPPQPEVAPAAPSRSPAEILRDRLAHKAAPDVRPQQPNQNQQARPAAPRPEKHNGEISREELEKVLNGGEHES